MGVVSAKVLIIATNAKMLVNFRGDLIQEMVRQGHDVVAACPVEGSEAYLRELGIRCRHVALSGTGTDPLADIRLLWDLRRLMLTERPDRVFAYAAKPVIYGSLTAKCSGVTSIYSMITGLGYVFVGKGLKASLLRLIMRCLYRLALRVNSRVIFQNPDDLHDFIKWRLVSPPRALLVNGSGVNMKRFAPAPLPKANVFIMVGRLIKDKGVREYLEAAKQVRQRYPDTCFKLLGPIDLNPSAISPEELRPYISSGVIEYLGEVDDVRPYLAASSVFVLPSYREGTPRSTLEAMAMGRPVITTDAPGCRETVVDGVNGLLVRPRDIPGLVSSMIWMIEHRDAAARMGEESVKLCVARFDVTEVNHAMLSAMGLTMQHEKPLR